MQGSGFRVQGSGFRVQGAGFRVQGSGREGPTHASATRTSADKPLSSKHGTYKTVKASLWPCLSDKSHRMLPFAYSRVVQVVLDESSMNQMRRGTERSCL